MSRSPDDLARVAVVFDCRSVAHLRAPKLLDPSAPRLLSLSAMYIDGNAEL